MKLFLIILADIIFISSFWILKCYVPDAFDKSIEEQKYKSAVNLFTDLRYSGYAIYGIICYMVAMFEYSNESEKYRLRVKYWLDIGIGFCLSDIVDRFYFNITKFTSEDVTMIALTFIISYIHVYFGNRISQYFSNKFNLYFPNTHKKIQSWLKKT